MRYLLDTVAISETSKPVMQSGMSEFLSVTADADLTVSVITLGEIHYGWSRLPSGRRRDALHSWAIEVEEVFADRTIDVDTHIALLWGELRQEVARSGNTISLPDLLIAATALHHDLTVVTRNIRDFALTGCKLLNPWDADTQVSEQNPG